MKPCHMRHFQKRVSKMYPVCNTNARTAEIFDVEAMRFILSEH
jgi:hypothetical protein